jgi:predicted N-acetyltransferase YhbS
MGSFVRAGRILRAVELAHPKRPQWYLQLLMVDPSHQRQGLGALLQEKELATCDAEGLPAWLETQKEENLAYYARFGFSVASEHRPIPSGPAMWSLTREPAG